MGGFFWSKGMFSYYYYYYYEEKATGNKKNFTCECLFSLLLMIVFRTQKYQRMKLMINKIR